MGNGKNIPRNFLANTPQAVSAKGIYIYDEQGKDYIDGCSGALLLNIDKGATEISTDIT